MTTTLNRPGAGGGLPVGVGYALLAAALFGASTPLAKALLGHVAPLLLAGLLYLGSGIGLSAFYLARTLLRRAPAGEGAGLVRGDLPWLAGAIAAGGVAGPVLLMAGLAVTPASSASLLLNMEGALTALLAWFVFKENSDRRILIGMLLIVLAGGLLSWDQVPPFGVPWGALAIVGACFCWGIDNNLTRKVSASDAVQIAAIKGLVAGAVNLGLALSLGLRLPALPIVMGAGAVGLAGYGISLVLFVVALRHLGAARTGAYFAAAPFVGAALSLLALRELPGMIFWIACVLMVIGIWLHLTESHAHTHSHDALAHVHAHIHDEHHQHTHDGEGDGAMPHVHLHRHAPLTHAHHHAPDIHHRHEH